MEIFRLALSLLNPSPALAACDPSQPGIQLGECLVINSKGDTIESTFATPADLVNAIVPNLFTIGGAILFIMFIYSGWRFIRSGTEGKEDAKKILKTAIIGFIIMFSAYWIVQVLGVLTGAPVL
jgi:hypothetical protein